MSVTVESFGLDQSSLIRQFVRFHWHLYKDDPYFCPDFNMEFLGNPLFGKKGLLTPQNSFHRHAETRFWLAKRDGKIVGRIAGCVDHNYIKCKNENAAHFGFYEAIDDADVAKVLLESVLEWTKSKQVERVYGPFNFSSNHTLGSLLHEIQDIPYFGTVYNPTYYNQHFTNAGFTKKTDIVALMMPVEMNEETKNRHERLERIVHHLKKKNHITVRPIDLKHFNSEIPILREIYNDSWANNWGFVPLDQEEFHEVSDGLKFIADPNLVHFAFVNNEPAAFIGSVPDINQAYFPKGWLRTNDAMRLIRFFMNKKKIDRARLLLFGIKEKYRKIGLDTLLFYESFQGSLKSNRYKWCEISWILEDNILVLRASEAMQAKEHRRWRIYEYNFGPTQIAM